MSVEVPIRRLAPGQSCEVWTVSVSDGTRQRRLVSGSRLWEAPNWTQDGTALILNGDGALWRLDLASGHVQRIPIEGVPALNNDHVLSPDGRHVYVSANDWHIYRAPLAGGRAERLTGRSGIAGLMHFLHGVSPLDGRLAFVGLRPEGDNWWAHADVFTMSATGDDYLRLTSGPGASDGSEYSPDGEWIYFNTEMFDGHAQVARMRVDGTGVQQLTFDDDVNWFPHLSPDGDRAAYLAFPPGTKGHPPDVGVELKVVDGDAWQAPRVVARLHGGQGTFNVNSWSPAGDAFAYVAYPLAAPP